MDSLAHDCRWLPIKTAEANVRVRASKDFSPVINKSHCPSMHGDVQCAKCRDSP